MPSEQTDLTDLKARLERAEAQIQTLLNQQRVIIKDAKGTERARLAVNSSNEAALVLMDKKGKVRVTLGVNENSEPSLVLLDDDEQARLALDFSHEGARVQLLSAGQKVLLDLRAGAKGPE